MRLSWGIDEAVAEYVAAQFPIAVERGGFDRFFRAVGIVDGSNLLVGGIVASEYRGHDCCLSIYASRPDFLRPAMIGELCRWCFGEAGFKRLTAQIAKRNKRARKFVEHVGFRLEGVTRHGWHDGSDDMCIYGMTFDACKWLETTAT